MVLFISSLSENEYNSQICMYIWGIMQLVCIQASIRTAMKSIGSPRVIRAFLIGIPYFFKIRSLQGSPCAREMCVLFATGRHLEYFIMMAEGHNGEGFAVSKLSLPLSSFHEVVKEKSKCVGGHISK